MRHRERKGSAVSVLAATALLVLGCRNRERGPYDFERMRVQQRYDLYAPSGVFADGKTMQGPPAGTVARETVNDPAAPPAPTPALLAEGRERFGVYCAVCHGVAGFGGSIVAANMGPPRPPSLRTARVASMPIDSVFAIASHGRGRMPSYAWQLSAHQRWAVAAYVKTLQGTPATSTDALQDSVDAARLRARDSTVAADSARGAEGRGR